MRRPAVAIVVLLAATFVSGCTEAPEQKGPVGDAVTLPAAAGLPALPEPLAFAAEGCEQAALLAPVDAAEAAALLPEGYEVYRDGSGLAWFGVSFMSCDAFSVAGAIHRHAVDVAETGIIVSSPDGTAGVHAYRLVGTTDADELGRRLAAFGAPGGTLDATDYVAESMLVATSHSGEAPWPGLGFALEASSSGSIAPLDALEAITWWSETADGTLRIGYTYSDAVVSPAQGTVSVESGSPFEDVLAGTESDAGGFLFTHTFSATAEHIQLG